MPDNGLKAFIRANAQKYKLDPKAVMGIGVHESGLRWDAVGDHGTSFGPFQLHQGGALPTGKGLQWASSPEGVHYALRRMGEVAGGLTGRAAIEAISRKFERPADPDAEISHAWQAYQGFKGGGKQAPYGRSAPQEAAFGNQSDDISDAARDKLIKFAMNSSMALSRGEQAPSPLGLVKYLSKQTLSNPTESMFVPHPAKRGPASTTVKRKSGALAEWLSEGVGGPTHSTGPHQHAAWNDPDAELAAIRQAQQLGLSVRENPYTDPVDPVHAKNSYHYATFPGLYGGKTLGKAIDVSGTADALRQWNAWVTKRYK